MRRQAVGGNVKPYLENIVSCAIVALTSKKTGKMYCPSAIDCIAKVASAAGAAIVPHANDLLRMFTLCCSLARSHSHTPSTFPSLSLSLPLLPLPLALPQLHSHLYAEASCSSYAEHGLDRVAYRRARESDEVRECAADAHPRKAIGHAVDHSRQSAVSPSGHPPRAEVQSLSRFFIFELSVCGIYIYNYLTLGRKRDANWTAVLQTLQEQRAADPSLVPLHSLLSLILP